MNKYRYNQIKWVSRNKPSWLVIGNKIGGGIVTDEEYKLVMKSISYEQYKEWSGGN